MADAEAIAEAALRPTMRTVPLKTPEQQSRAMLFRTRELLVSQRTQMINALRAHLAEHGIVVGKGAGNVWRLGEVLEDMNGSLPKLVCELAVLYLERIEQTCLQIKALEKQIAIEAKQSAIARRLQTMPGIGPVCAMAVETFAPDMSSSEAGATSRHGWASCRDNIRAGASRSSANLEDGTARHPPPSDRGGDVRRPWKGRGGGTPAHGLRGCWPKKPRILVAIALANKMARMIWAMLTRKEEFRDPTERSADHQALDGESGM